jgi:protein-L-isoaspartate(D-aspartate) O-methyltransferase
MDDPVGVALRAVSPTRFCFDGHGNQLPQTSSPEMIARMLRLLDVQKGARVLEVGTGSGYSTALLAELTGPHGMVVSLDVDRELTRRAQGLLASDGYGQVLLVTADGLHGWRSRAPYDRLVAWVSVSEVPQAWREQTAPGAALVVPMRVEEQPWISMYRRTEGGSLVEVERIAGGFIPLTRTPFRPWEGAGIARAAPRRPRNPNADTDSG